MGIFVVLDLFAEGTRESLDRVPFEIKVHYHENIEKRRFFLFPIYCVNKNNILSMEEKEDLCTYIRRYRDDVWTDISYKLLSGDGGYIKIPYTKIELTNGIILYVRNSIREILGIV